MISIDIKDHGFPSVYIIYHIFSVILDVWVSKFC